MKREISLFSVLLSMVLLTLLGCSDTGVEVEEGEGEAASAASLSMGEGMVFGAWPESVNLKCGESQQVWLYFQYPPSPRLYSIPDQWVVTWRSVEPDIATVDEKGNVVGQAPGKTMIIADFSPGDSDPSGDFQILVTVE